jgi:hypothetical protein
MIMLALVSRRPLTYISLPRAFFLPSYNEMVLNLLLATMVAHNFVHIGSENCYCYVECSFIFKKKVY